MPITDSISRKAIVFAFLCIIPIYAVASPRISSSANAAVVFDVKILDEFDDLLLEAYSLYTQKKYDEALKLCAEAAKMRPTDNRPHAISGVIYMAQWKMKSASDALAVAISFSPKNKQLFLHKAKADRFRNARDEAILAARGAIEIDPSFAEAYEVLGDAFSIGSKNTNEAIEAYRTAIKLKPNLLTSYAQLGMLLSVYGDKNEAMAVYRKAMELDPNKMACRFDLGRLLVDEGRLVEARTVWDGRTTDKDNTFPNLITVLERAEKLKLATETLAKNPEDPDALFQMGVITMDGESWVADKRQERAIVFFKKALALRPDFAKARYEMCKAYVQLADTFKNNIKILDEELVQLRKLDAKLADEIVLYRKNYSGGLKASGTSVNQ